MESPSGSSLKFDFSDAVIDAAKADPIPKSVIPVP